MSESEKDRTSPHASRSDDSIPLTELLERYQDQHARKAFESVIRDKRLRFRPREALRLEQLPRHMFERLADHGGCRTNLLYNIGSFLPGLDPLEISRRQQPLTLSSSQLFALVTFLSTMERGKGNLIPNATRLRERALFIYKATGAVPVAIVRLQFDSLPELPLDKLAVDTEGRFMSCSRLPFEQHHILATAPLMEAVIARKFEMIFLDEFVITNFDQMAELRLRFPNQESATYRNGLRYPAKTEGDYFPYAVLADRGARAVSWIDVVAPPARLADRRFALFRKQQSAAEQESAEATSDE